MSHSRIVVIHSLTAHGVVGLKTFLPVLGELCLPVPSLLLTGPGDMPGCARFDYDFASMLRGTLAAAAAKDERVELFVGYLANAGQVQTILETITTFRAHIGTVFVDPVCGDNGRSYVRDDLLAAWPRLLAVADWAFPNLTEAGLLTGTGDEAVGDALRQLNPCARFVVTGIPIQPEGRIGLRLLGPDVDATFTHPSLPYHANGTGDLFAALFLVRLLVERMSPIDAVRSAATGVADTMRLAAARGETSLSVRAVG